MQFPRLVIPLSTVLTSAMNFALNILAVFVFMLIYGVEPRLTWLLLPIALMPLIVLTTGVSMLLSALYVRYRDVAPIWAVISQVLFYGSPIFYTIDQAKPGWQRHVIMSNPLACILEQARRWLVDPSAPGAIDAAGGLAWFLIPTAIFLAVIAFGLWVFNNQAPKIAERL